MEDSQTLIEVSDDEAPHVLTNDPTFFTSLKNKEVIKEDRVPDIFAVSHELKVLHKPEISLNSEALSEPEISPTPETSPPKETYTKILTKLKPALESERIGSNGLDSMTLRKAGASLK